MPAKRLSIVLLVLFVSCDAPAVVEVKTNVSGDRAGLADCLHSCAAERLSDTDRATCRLNCEASYRVTPSDATTPALAQAANCIDACGERDKAACVAECGGPEALVACVDECGKDPRQSADDRATCRLLCAQASAPAP
jgi:hypothetical protein